MVGFKVILFQMLNVTSESITQTGSRGRGGGRGAPFGNSQQRRELRKEMSSSTRCLVLKLFYLHRRPIGAPGPSLDILSDQMQNIELNNSFNINAVEFVPK